MEYRVPIIIALVVLLILVFIWKRRSTKGKAKSKSKAKSKAKPKKASRKQDSGGDIDDDDFSDDESSNEKRSSSGDITADARELYDVVHNDLAGGMQIDAFEEAAGDLAGDDSAEVFVALKQKYTEAIDSNRDPMRSIGVKDYVEVLKKSG